MQAIGVGDVDLHCVDNMGNPCVLPLKDVICIPEANKSLVSVSMLAKQGYQCVYPCPDPVFPPGVYQPRRNHKSGARGEPCIFVGYPSNQKGYLVWCPTRGPNAVVSTTNVFFGLRLPRATRPVVEIFSEKELVQV